MRRTAGTNDDVSIDAGAFTIDTYQLVNGTHHVRIVATDSTGRVGSADLLVISSNQFPALQVSTGSNHSCAVLYDHEVSCTGLNSSGQIGQLLGTNTVWWTPVPNLRGVSTVSAGGDFKMLEALRSAKFEEARQHMLAFYARYLSILDLEIPVVAAIEGPAIGAGLCVALACDLVVVAEDAKLALNFVALGLHPGMGATYLVPHRLGAQRAADLLLTGRRFDGKEALALGLAANGISTGLLDADIYGPSMPRMLAVKEKPESLDGKQLKPIERYGLRTMSIGYIVNEDTPMIWRGPMVSSALEQMLRDVQWGELDVLVVDMPPGTGDAQLTLAQRVALSGAVIVSTPQDIALVDARKGLNMFRKVAVPVLGIVENMSYFLCPKCGERSEIFGHGGAHEEADKLGVPFLGEVPLHLDIRTTSDNGHPIVVSKPDSAHAQAYRNIAGRVWKQLSANQRGPRAAPRIVVR